jgi:uncharacterized membrane protein
VNALERRWRSFGAKQAAYVAVFAALSVVVITFVPRIPIIGLPGGGITLDAAIAPVYGIVLGPYLGALAALIGGIVVAGTKGWVVFNVLTSFSPAASALVAGMLTRRGFGFGKRNAGGWIGAASILVVLTAVWYVTWVGQRAPLYPVLQIAGLLIILLFRGRISTLFESAKRKNVSLAVLLSSYCGLVSDHMLGNLVYILGIGLFIPLEAVEEALKAMGLPSIPALFMFVLPISVVERALMSVIATIFGTALILALRSSRLMPE